jgi:predicted enzyme related to lactoylglutathione lyase
VKRRYLSVICLCALPAFAQDTEGTRAPAPVVYFDITGEASADLASFYGTVFDWEISPDGSVTAQIKSPPLVPRADYPAASIGFRTSVTAPLPGQIRQEPAGKRIYLGVPDVAATLLEIEEAGGTIQAPRFEVPGVVVLGLFLDPAGNAMGLVEMDGDRVKIP